MKRVLSMICAVVILTLAAVPAASADAAYQKGDADMDGHITIDDVTTVQRYLSELLPCEGFWKFSTADADNDGELNVKDVTLLQRELAQFETMFGGTPDGNATIAQAAVSMAYKHHGEGYLAPGKPLYQSVFNLVMPGSYPLRSCDRFVCASVRRSGADDNYPEGHVGIQADYLDAHPEKWQDLYGFLDSDTYRYSEPYGMEPGDIIIEYSAYDFRSHTFVYCGAGLIAMIYPDVAEEGYDSASANYDDTAPQCLKWVLSYNMFRVFRCKQYESTPAYKHVGLWG